MIVVDASIAVKWFLNEPGSREALALFHQPYKLIAPALIRMEVLAAIAKRVRMAELAAEDATKQMERWHSTLAKRALFLVDDDQQYQQAAALSLQERHNFYDCVYLYLAKNLGVPLVTADQRLADLAKKLGIQSLDWRSAHPLP
ncbi:MAG: type II toxin-antitoxin system VapC family toxin [Nostoc sp.]|uniref:type II toxin-antitoxin system VapC family toxin n=1 Tax=Nostoc sp. TaxID=1180 RepID=UPI002FEFC4C3